MNVSCWFLLPHFLSSFVLIPFSYFNWFLQTVLVGIWFCLCLKSIRFPFGNSSIQTAGNLNVAVIPGMSTFHYRSGPKQMLALLDSADQAHDPNSSYQMLFLRQLSQWQRDNRKVCNIHTAGVACSPHSCFTKIARVLILAPLQSPWFLPISSVITPSSHDSVTFLVVFQ